MFAGMRTTYIPVTIHSYKSLQIQGQPESVFLDMEDLQSSPPTTNPQVMAINDLALEAKMTFPAYTISAAAFWGQILIVVFMITGLVSIPFGLINAWRDRPKPMSEKQFKQEKEALARQVD